MHPADPQSAPQNPSARPAGSPSRRDFMRYSTAAVVGAAVAATSSIPRAVHAAEAGPLKVGLIGCGGRGSGAAVNILNAAKMVKMDVRIVALADMFPDKLEASLKNLKASDVGENVTVKDDHKFVGWDAYKGLIQAVDVVLLATPPHFRPMHLKAAVEAGKHVFCEKPVAVDVPGVRSVMETSKLAKDRGISLLSGLCYRYDPSKIATIDKIHNGGIGDVMVVQSNYLTGPLWSNPRKPEWSDMEWQLRNWLYFTWLSGDHIVEQHIHSLDKALWVMKDQPPMKVTATGGRIQRTQPEFGNIYDHFATMYEWENGAKVLSHCRQLANADADVSDHIYGTEGVAHLMQHRIEGKNNWRTPASKVNMYDAEHVELLKSIRDNKPLNNGDYMTKSTLMAIMGRMSAYTGKTIAWDDVMASNMSLTPPAYQFGPLEVAPVAIPGQTKMA